MNNYNPSKVISYVNLDISDGKIYKILGFKKNKYSGLNYWWAKNIRYHRSNFMKHKLVLNGENSHLTEDEIMRLNGFLKIYGIGTESYIYYKTP